MIIVRLNRRTLKGNMDLLNVIETQAHNIAASDEALL